MDVQSVTLVGRAVRLEPLTAAHAAGLCATAGDTALTYIYTKPHERTPAAFAAYIHTLYDDFGWCPFAIMDHAADQPVGVSCYLDIRPAHRGLEIGGTWIAASRQGTAVNPEAKYLLLHHAFETLGAVRVQLKTDGRNLQSQAAIAKLGAVREGVLRRHLILPDGYVRDTVMYSITDSEWPSVRDRLVARLGYTPGA